MKHRNIKANAFIGGTLIVTTYRDGKVVRKTLPIKNKVVSSDGYGRNLVLRQLAGDQVYPITIDSASVGSSSTASADAQTNLITPVATNIPITNKTVVGNQLNMDVFVADGVLPNGSYAEFGLFCNGRLFSRIVISPSYTKASGEDTLFTYQLTLNG